MVSATDSPHRWFVRLVPGLAPEVREAVDGERADAKLENRAENLLYQLWNRMRLTGTGETTDETAGEAEGETTVLHALRMS